MFTKLEPMSERSSSSQSLSEFVYAVQERIEIEPYEIHRIYKCDECHRRTTIMRRIVKVSIAERAWYETSGERISANFIGICENKDCRNFRDITKIQNWRKEHVEIDETKKTTDRKNRSYHRANSD